MSSSPTRLLRPGAGHPGTTQMRMGTRMRTWATSRRVAGRRYRISTRLGTRRGASTSPATVAASSRSRRSRFRRLTRAMPSAREATLSLGVRRPQPRNRSHRRGREGSLAPVTNRIRCRLISTITTCPMRRSKLSARNRSRNGTWSSSPVTVTTSDNPSPQMTASAAKSTPNSKSPNPRPSSIKQLMSTQMAQKTSKNRPINGPSCTF